MVDILERFFRDTLGNIDNWRTLIRIAPSFDYVDNVLVDAIGIEIGPKRHFVHAHAAVTIEHHGSIKWRGTQRKWQEMFNAHARLLRGSYVNITLMDADALNYASKYPRDNIVQFGMQPAVTF